MKLNLNIVENMFNPLLLNLETKTGPVCGKIAKKILPPANINYNNVSILNVLSNKKLKDLKKIITLDTRFFPHNKLVQINTANFDKFYKQETHSYIGQGGKGIGAKNDHYNWIKKNWVLKGKSFSASEVSLIETGNNKKPLEVIFHEGRHRYSVLRDLGMKNIPLSLDKDSIIIAKKFNLL